MVILNFLAAPRAARTGRARDLGEQENWGEAFQKTDTYANLALGKKQGGWKFSWKLINRQTQITAGKMENFLKINKQAYSFIRDLRVLT